MIAFVDKMTHAITEDEFFAGFVPRQTLHPNAPIKNYVA